MLFTLPAQLPTIAGHFTPTIELRGRFERRDDGDFTESLNDNVGTLLTRGRLGLTCDLDAMTQSRLVYQFAMTNVEPTVGGGSDVRNQDLLEAYIARRAGGSTLTLGRQKVGLGGQRLVGATEWANSSRSWLGVRLDSGDWGLFWGELEVNPVPNPKAQIAFATWRCLFGDTSLIYKHDTAPATRTSLTTVDHRFSRSFGALSLVAEGAFQWGRKGGLDHEAWAATMRGDLRLDDRFKVFVEGNVATGGSTAANGHAFDNLYPTNHQFYGMMDLQGWSNMKGLAAGVLWQANRDLSFEVSYHDFSLYDETDGWYGASGAINRRGGVPYVDPTGTSGSHVGSEVDLVARMRVNQHLALDAGFGVFTPGAFVKSFLGGPSTNSTFGYVQANYRF